MSRLEHLSALAIAGALLLTPACDRASEDKPAPAPAEPLVCGLYQTQTAEAMTALSICTGKATAAVAAKAEAVSCAAQLTAVTTATEDFLECIEEQDPGGGVDGAIRKMNEHADRVCACADQACAEKVMGELTKWAATTEAELGRKPELSTKQQAQMEDATKRLTECMMKAMTR